MTEKEFCLIGCDTEQYLSKQIDNELSGSPGYRGMLDFDNLMHPDKELEPRIKEYVRGNEAYVVHELYSPTTPERSINDNLMSLCLAIQAMGKADAEKITAIIPYYAYSRSDRRSGKELGLRKPIAARLAADFIVVSGADRVVTVDIHNESIEGFFPSRFPLENIYTTNLLLPELVKQYSDYIDHAVVLSLDMGGAKRNAYKADQLKIPTVVLDKARDIETGKTKIRNIVGDPKGKYCIAIDDIAATVSSLDVGTDAVMNAGAKGIIGCFSIPMFVGPAIERLDKLYDNGNGPLIGVIGTDAVWHGYDFEKQHPYYSCVKIAPTIANTIKVMQKIHEEGSLHQELDVNAKRF